MAPEDSRKNLTEEEKIDIFEFFFPLFPGRGTNTHHWPFPQVPLGAECCPESWKAVTGFMTNSSLVGPPYG